jgi:hypothetical protein
MTSISFQGEKDILNVTYLSITDKFVLCLHNDRVYTYFDNISDDMKFYSSRFSENEIELMIHIICNGWNYKNNAQPSLHYDVRFESNN